jgi:hypothetical protein
MARETETDGRKALSVEDVTLQMAESPVPRQMFADILWLIAQLRAPPAPA